MNQRQKILSLQSRIKQLESADSDDLNQAIANLLAALTSQNQHGENGAIKVALSDAGHSDKEDNSVLHPHPNYFANLNKMFDHYLADVRVIDNTVASLIKTASKKFLAGNK